MWKRLLESFVGKRKPVEPDMRARAKAWLRAKTAETALILAEVISGGDPEVMALVRLAVDEPEEYVRTYCRYHHHPKSAAEVDPFYAALDALTTKGHADFIDWRSDADELMNALNPLLKRAGIEDFDWSFINEMIEAGEGESLRNDNLLPIVGRRIADRGLVLLWFIIQCDNYNFAVLKPEEFAKVDGLRGPEFEIGTFQ